MDTDGLRRLAMETPPFDETADALARGVLDPLPRADDPLEDQA